MADDPVGLVPEPFLEPLALLHGSAAAAAVAAGRALPLAGGTTAFAAVRPVDDPGAPILVTAIPDLLRPAVARLAAPFPDAGLPPGFLVMGILNVTPDSFSDGGRFPDAGAAVAAGLRLAAEGADLVDVGGESTRPDAQPVPPDEERRRVLPVVRALAASGIRVSIDSRNAATLAAALDAGAVLANDVSALRHDPATAPALAARGGAVCLMHMRGEPRTMAGLAEYRSVLFEVFAELGDRVAAARAAGIAPGRLLLDPGIGFAKRTAHNLSLLRHLPVFAALGCRLVLGVSRKRFLGELAGDAPPAERLPGSLAALVPGLDLPGTIFRVHDVRETVQALRVWGAIRGDGLPG